MSVASDDPDIGAKVMDIIAHEGAVDRARVTPDATLETLEIKSMDIVMILNGIEEEFDLYIPVDESLSHLVTVQDIVAEVSRRIVERKAKA
jgi:acyl carrier protein